MGVVAAALLENIHSAFWDWNRRYIETPKGKGSSVEGPEGRSTQESITNFMSRVLEYNDEDVCWPWVHDSAILSYFYASVDSAAPSKKRGYHRVSDGSLSPSLLDDTLQSPLPLPNTSFFIFCCYLWRFFPDLTSIGIGFLMSTLGVSTRYEPS